MLSGGIDLHRLPAGAAERLGEFRCPVVDDNDGALHLVGHLLDVFRIHRATERSLVAALATLRTTVCVVLVRVVHRPRRVEEVDGILAVVLPHGRCEVADLECRGFQLLRVAALVPELVGEDDATLLRHSAVGLPVAVIGERGGSDLIASIAAVQRLLEESLADLDAAVALGELPLANVVVELDHPAVCVTENVLLGERLVKKDRGPSRERFDVGRMVREEARELLRHPPLATGPGDERLKRGLTLQGHDRSLAQVQDL